MVEFSGFLYKRKPLIGVIGGNTCSPQVAQLAEEVGRRIANKDGVLVCGGLGGVMEAASKGAKQAGGQTIGVLPGDTTDRANPYIDFPIVTGMGFARNVIIVKTADVLIAIDGNHGTLTEVAYALIFKKPVISLESWEIDPKIQRAKDPQEAVELAFRALAEHSRS